MSSYHTIVLNWLALRDIYPSQEDINNLTYYTETPDQEKQLWEMLKFLNQHQLYPDQKTIDQLAFNNFFTHRPLLEWFASLTPPRIPSKSVFDRIQKLLKGWPEYRAGRSLANWLEQFYSE